MLYIGIQFFGGRGSGGGKNSGGGGASKTPTAEEAYEDWFEYENAALMKEYSETGKMPSTDMYGHKLSKDQKERLKADADALSKAAEATTPDKIVYRGMVVDPSVQFKRGQTITTDSLTAVTPDKRLAKTYSDTSNSFVEGGRSVTMVYESPKGIRGYKANSGMETVMPKGETYRVTRVDNSGGQTTVYLYKSKRKR